MIFNAIFNTISVISWRSVLMVEETGVLGINPYLPQVSDKHYHIKMYRHERDSNFAESKIHLKKKNYVNYY